MLVQLKNKGSIDGEISTDSRKLTLNECIAQGFVFFLAGSDTTSNVLASALMELGHHSEIQERLRQEINDVTQTVNGELTYDNLHVMPYLNQVINDSLKSQQKKYVFDD